MTTYKLSKLLYWGGKIKIANILNPRKIQVIFSVSALNMKFAANMKTLKKKPNQLQTNNKKTL